MTADYSASPPSDQSSSRRPWVTGELKNRAVIVPKIDMAPIP